MTRTNTPAEERRAAEKRRSSDPPLDAERDRIARSAEADGAGPEPDATAESRLVPEASDGEPHLRGEPRAPEDVAAMDALKLTAETSRRTG